MEQIKDFAIQWLESEIERGQSSRAMQAIDALLQRGGVDDGARTRDSRNHNPGLYQLSYVHHRRKTNWRARQESNLQPPA